MYKKFRLLLDYSEDKVINQIKLEQYIMRSGLSRSFILRDSVLEIDFKDDSVENPYEAMHSILSDAYKGGLLKGYSFIEIEGDLVDWI